MHYSGKLAAGKAEVLIKLLAAALCLLPGAASAAADQPAWAAPEMAARVCFNAEPAKGARVALRVEPLTGDKATGFAAFDSKGRSVPFEVVYRDNSKADILVDPGEENGEAACSLYYDGPKVQAQPALEPRQEKNPVRMEISKAGVKNIPSTWAGMLYLIKAAVNPQSTAAKPAFEPTQLFDESSEEHKSRQLFLVTMASIVLFPEKGAYRFSIDCKNAGAVLVDGEMVVAWPGEHEGGIWKTGPALDYEPGLHRVEVVSLCGSRSTARLGWTLPGSKGPVEVPTQSLLTWRQAADTRVDMRDRAVQPDFSQKIQPGYIFRGQPGIFIPVALKNTTVKLPGLKRKLQAKWRFDGYGEKEGNAVVAVFTSAVPQKVTLEIDDGSGRTLICEKMVDCRYARQLEYVVEADVKKLPATCYPLDMIAPELWISGTVPAGEALTVEWTIKGPTSQLQAGSTNIVPAVEPAVIQFPELTAGLISSIRWSATYKGAPVKSQDINFLSPPFSKVPCRVSGEALYSSSGERLVLVAVQKAGSFSQPSINAACAKAGILFTEAPFIESLDGKRKAPRTHLDGIVGYPERVPFVHAVAPGWGNSPESLGPLLKLVQTPELASSFGGAIALSPALRDLTDSADLEDFERQIAALSDLLSMTLNKKVIWMTPPPYPGMSTTARDFAVRIRRVADARRIPVVDLYSLFSGLKGEIRPFNGTPDLDLSEEGRRLAARAINSALFTR